VFQQAIIAGDITTAVCPYLHGRAGFDLSITRRFRRSPVSPIQL